MRRVRITGKFAQEATDDYDRLCLAVRQLLPTTLTEAGERLGLHRATLSNQLNAHTALNVGDLSRLLALSHLDTAALVTYVWTGQPPGLAHDLRRGYEPPTRREITERGELDAQAVLEGVRQLLTDREISLYSLPAAVGWATTLNNPTMWRYLRADIDFPWARLLQVLRYLDLDPAEFADRYLPGEAGAVATGSAG